MTLTVAFAVYGQPAMLEVQLRTFAAYKSPALRSSLKLIVVDDAGDPPVDKDALAEFELDTGIDTELYRVTKDIPWNQGGARNLAVHVAPDGWLLLIDPDMVFSEDVMARMVLASEAMIRGHVARYALRHASTGEIDMTSPNTYLIHRQDFLDVGGYDEDYAGHKGWSDVQLLDILGAHYKLSRRPDLFAEFYSNALVSDAMVTKLDRSTKHNRAIRLKKFEQAKSMGGWKRWVKQKKGPNLRFPWVKLFPAPQ